MNKPTPAQMAMRWRHVGSLEQIGMADKWKLSPKRVVVVSQQGRRMVCEGGGHRLRMSGFSSCLSGEVGLIQRSLNVVGCWRGAEGSPLEANKC